MAKMFYSLEEAALKLGTGEEQIKQMAADGKLQQYRDGEKLMFKREQVDQMADHQPTGLTGLADAAEGPYSPMSLDDTLTDSLDDLDDTGPIPIVDNEDTDTDVINVSNTESIRVDRKGESSVAAVSVFDADEIEPADPSAKTQMANSAADEDEIALENVGSGSGLLDLTRESDDTSLGAELLDEIYPGGEASDQKMDAGPSMSGIFEGQLPMEASSATGLEHHLQSSAVPSPAPPTAPITLTVEDYDPAGNGLSGGLLLGAAVTMVIVMFVAIFALAQVPSSLTSALAGNSGLYSVGFLLLTGVFGVIGFLIGRSQQV